MGALYAQSRMIAWLKILAYILMFKTISLNSGSLRQDMFCRFLTMDTSRLYEQHIYLNIKYVIDVC